MTGSYTYTFEDIQNRPVAVIGAGTLGRRVALMFATRGGPVRIHARRAEQRAEATQFVSQALPKLVADRGFGEVGVVTATGSLDEALDGTWLVVDSGEVGPTDHPDEFHDHELIGLAAVTTDDDGAVSACL